MICLLSDLGEFGGTKTKIPSQSVSAGTGNYPAVPPGLAYDLRPLMHTNICRLFYGESGSVLHTQSKNFFPLALGSPFGAIFSAAITPSAALCGKRGVPYSHFLIGFLYYITTKVICQEVVKNSFHFAEIAEDAGARGTRGARFLSDPF